MQTETTNAVPAAVEIDDVRLLALASLLGEPAEDLFDEGDNEYSSGRQRYLVLTDEEADEKATELAADSLWAFNISHLRNYIPALCNARAAAAFDKMRESLCEDANDLVAAMLGDRLDDCIRDAITCDGRAHFLNTYDGDESTAVWKGHYFYVFRMN